jgi:hypothetical protein
LTAVVIPAYLTLREHEVLLILRSVVKMSGDVVSCLLSEFHWPVSGVSGNLFEFRRRPLLRRHHRPKRKIIHIALWECLIAPALQPATGLPACVCTRRWGTPDGAGLEPLLHHVGAAALGAFLDDRLALGDELAFGPAVAAVERLAPLGTPLHNLPFRMTLGGGAVE